MYNIGESEMTEYVVMVKFANGFEARGTDIVSFRSKKTAQAIAKKLMATGRYTQVTVVEVK